MWSKLLVAASIFANVLAQGCSPLHLVYARATGEPPQSYGEDFDGAASKYWSKGYGVAGYSLSTNLTSLVPGATGWPVHYPASMGSLSNPNIGATEMIKQLMEKSRACPSQKYALGGHSQGGFVTVATISKLPADILNKVVAVTIFGSSPCPASVQGRCISYCQAGDTVCAGGGKGGTKNAKSTKSAKSAVVLTGEARDLELVIRAELAVAAPKCAEYASVATTGLGKGGHLGYNADGTYVKAAACFIAAKFTGSS